MQKTRWGRIPTNQSTIQPIKEVVTSQVPNARLLKDKVMATAHRFLLTKACVHKTLMTTSEKQWTCLKKMGICFMFANSCQLSPKKEKHWGIKIGKLLFVFCVFEEKWLLAYYAYVWRMTKHFSICSLRLLFVFLYIYFISDVFHTSS